MEFPPVQVSPLSNDRVVREGVTQEVDVLPCDLAGEDVAILLLSSVKELEWVGPELQSTTQIGDEAILNYRLARLPMYIEKKEKTIFSTNLKLIVIGVR